MSDQTTSYVLDGAPITVRGSDSWSSRSFRAHLPVLYFFQLLEEQNPERTTITPVIDVVRPNGYDQIQGSMLRDFNRRTSIANLHPIDEATRKMPNLNGRVGSYINFLRNFDDLSGIDGRRSLIYDGNRVTSFNDHRLSCTLAECLVYHDKMELAGDSDEIVMLTGYDESYLQMYGPNSRFREFKPELERNLEAHFRRPVTIVDFVYATNPKGLNLPEYCKNFDRFLSEEQERILLSNTLYVLSMAHLYENNNAPSNLRQFREQCMGLPNFGQVRDLIQTRQIRTQEDFYDLARDAYSLVEH